MTNSELERLAMLAEELTEVGQNISKAIRHGYSSRHPMGGPTNRELIELELGDVFAIVELMATAKDLQIANMLGQVPVKLGKLRRYTHHQPASLLSEVLVPYEGD